jgi:hypothetical protein
VGRVGTRPRSPLVQRIRISEASLHTFKQRLKRYTGRNWFVSMEVRLSAAAAAPLRPRVDELLRDLRDLWGLTRTGYLAASPGPHVLLGDVASSTSPDQALAGHGRSDQACGRAGSQ